MQTKIFSINTLTLQEKEEIDAILKRGGVIGFPTETVYGIGCSMSKEETISRLYQLKNRPESKAFSLHLGSPEQIPLVTDIHDPSLLSLINHFCPGPITFVVPKKNNQTFSKKIGTEDSVGIRIPDHPALCNLIMFHKMPLIGTSANLSSFPPATTAEEVASYFDGKIEAILDGGPCKRKKASSVINVCKIPFELLREGEITLEEVINVYNQILRE